MTAGLWVGRVLLVLLRPLIWLLFPYRIYGKENVPQDDRPLVLCCNHISYLDPVFLLIGARRRPIYFMGKDELFQNKFFGWILQHWFGVFPVSRGKGDMGAINKALSLVRDGRIMGIFPEGTRSKTGALGRGKSGASLIISQTGADMLPACVVAEGQRVRMFHRSVAVFGKPLTCAQLHLDGEKPELRYASRLIMSTIGGLMTAQGWQPPQEDTTA